MGWWCKGLGSRIQSLELEFRASATGSTRLALTLWTAHVVVMFHRGFALGKLKASPKIAQQVSAACTAACRFPGWLNIYIYI